MYLRLSTVASVTFVSFISVRHLTSRPPPPPPIPQPIPQTQNRRAPGVMSRSCVRDTERLVDLAHVSPLSSVVCVCPCLSLSSVAFHLVYLRPASNLPPPPPILRFCTTAPSWANSPPTLQTWTGTCCPPLATLPPALPPPDSARRPSPAVPSPPDTEEGSGTGRSCMGTSCRISTSSG